MWNFLIMLQDGAGRRSEAVALWSVAEREMKQREMRQMNAVVPGYGVGAVQTELEAGHGPGRQDRTMPGRGRRLARPGKSAGGRELKSGREELDSEVQECRGRRGQTGADKNGAGEEEAGELEADNGAGEEKAGELEADNGAGEEEADELEADNGAGEEEAGKLKADNGAGEEEAGRNWKPSSRAGTKRRNRATELLGTVVAESGGVEDGRLNDGVGSLQLLGRCWKPRSMESGTSLSSTNE